MSLHSSHCLLDFSSGEGVGRRTYGDLRLLKLKKPPSSSSSSPSGLPLRSPMGSRMGTQARDKSRNLKQHKLYLLFGYKVCVNLIDSSTCLNCTIVHNFVSLYKFQKHFLGRAEVFTKRDFICLSKRGANKICLLLYGRLSYLSRCVRRKRSSVARGMAAGR
jgi:hypothetical protein